MRRREFIGLLGGAAVWPHAGHAQPAEMRHLGALFVVAEPQAARLVAALKEGLQKAGWTEGRNLQITLRFGWSDPDRIRRYTDELVALKPDVIMAQGVVGAAILQRATKTIPVVFAQVQDPVGGGFVTSLSRPEANLTGFTDFEYSVAVKWMQLLKEVAPHVTRALILINPDNRARWNGYMGAVERHASSLGLRPVPAGVHDAAEIERAMAAFVQEPNGGVIVLPDATTSVHSSLIMELAARHRLPAVFSNAYISRSGALLTYSSVGADQYRGAATYIDRILRGAKPGELPVQAIERFDMVINLRTARALGLEVSPTLLARADEVIE
ncbi:MAG TPA: ABC transporter substrate-binding protein [Microvirga sp.]|nr:ABC transporter substrate-binding protein [Microvirga sp.]